jgi:hypothetical protein
MEGHGELTRQEGEGEGEEGVGAQLGCSSAGAVGRGRAAGGGYAMGLGPAAPLLSPAACVMCCLRGRREGGKREEK